MYFLIFQPDDMLKLCLKFNESHPIYADKLYAYKKVYRVYIAWMVFLSLEQSPSDGISSESSQDQLDQ